MSWTLTITKKRLRCTLRARRKKKEKEEIKAKAEEFIKSRLEDPNLSEKAKEDFPAI